MNSDIVMALIAAIGGGFGVKILDIMLTRMKFGQDFTAETSKAMREDIKKLSDRVDLLQASLDEWKQKYYDLQNRNVVLETKYTDLQEEYESLKGQHQSLKDEKVSLEKRCVKMQGEIDELQKRVSALSKLRP